MSVKQFLDLRIGENTPGGVMVDLILASFTLTFLSCHIDLPLVVTADPRWEDLVSAHVWRFNREDYVAVEVNGDQSPHFIVGVDQVLSGPVEGQILADVVGRYGL